MDTGVASSTKSSNISSPEISSSPTYRGGSKLTGVNPSVDIFCVTVFPGVGVMAVNFKTF